MIEKLCTGREMEIIIIVLLVVLLLLFIGKGAGKLLVPALKKLLGKGEVNINIAAEVETDETKGKKVCKALIDPKNCIAHLAETERSLRNEREIGLLWLAHTDANKEVRKKLDSIQEGNQKILLVLLDKGFPVPRSG